jgi:hypothetical protein
MVALEHDHSARSVLGWLVAGVNDDGEVWPHVATLADWTGLDVRNVRRAVARLRGAGALTVTRTRRGNVYHLAAPPCDEVPRDQERARPPSNRGRRNQERARAPFERGRGRPVREGAGALSIEGTRSVNEVVRARDEPAVVDYYPPPDPDDAYALAARPVPAVEPAAIVARLDDLEVMRLAPKLHLEPRLAAQLARFEAKAAQARRPDPPTGHTGGGG